MADRLLSSGDMCEVTRLEPHVFNDWCVKGIVEPVEGGAGQGNHRRFTVMQVVGLAVANQLRRSERGCALPYVAKVVEAFRRKSETELKDKFNRGGKFFWMVADTKAGPFLVLDGPRYPDGIESRPASHYDGLVDVERTYHEVLGAIARIERRLRDQSGGRLRGLAGAGTARAK